MPPIKKEDQIRFQEEIENIVWKLDVGYIEAIMIFCEENDYEVESIPKLISPKLKSEIEKEANDLSLLKEKMINRLPI